MFKLTSKIELHTDASAVGLGAIFLQKERLGDPLRLVFCVSKITSETESRYHFGKFKLMSVV